MVRFFRCLGFHRLHQISGKGPCCFNNKHGYSDHAPAKATSSTAATAIAFMVPCDGSGENTKDMVEEKCRTC